MTAAKPKRQRTKTAVHAFTEGGFIVRGTLDPMTALRLAVAELDDCQLGGVIYDGCRPVMWEEHTPTPDEISKCADRIYELLAEARPGLWRFVPTQDDDYAWFVRGARNRGPGVFEGVSFHG